MLANFVDDSFLRLFRPRLAADMYSGITTYAPQISIAYARLQRDLYARGLDPKKIMVPLDLKRPLGTSGGYKPGDPPLIVTESATTNGLGYPVSNQRRYVINVASVTGKWAIKLQGSLRQALPDPSDTSWVDVPNASFTISEAGTQSTVFDSPFSWHRAITTMVSAGTIVYSTYLLDTAFDEIIAHAAFSIIFNDLIVEPNDIWVERRNQAEGAYASGLDAARFSYDSNADGIPDAFDSKEDRYGTLRVRR